MNVLPIYAGKMNSKMDRPIQVLIVEDDLADAELVRAHLSSAGSFKVLHAQTIARGLQLLEQGPDIVLLDLSLPDAHGAETYQVMLEKAGSIPVIVLTGDSNEQMSLQSVHCGVQDYLFKDRLNSDLLKRSILYGIERKSLLRKLEDAYLYDELTGLPSQSYLLQKLEHSMALAQDRSDFQFTLLFVNLDSFNRINESLGHSVGNKIIKAMAERIQSRLPKNAMLARYGGDEFAILLNDTKSLDEAVRCTTAIQEAITPELRMDDNELRMTASVGIATSESDYESGEAMLRDADSALIRAKKLGRGRYAIFHPQMHEQALARMNLEADMRKALKDEEFTLFYQPLFAAGQDFPFGFETLIRWFHPAKGMVSPGEFIPIAEDTGLIIPLSEWILYEACRQTRTWNELYGLNMSVSVNISATHFDQNDFVDFIQQILADTGLNPSRLKLEITEGTIMTNVDFKIGQLTKLKRLGVEIWIDDFGTGYSSLNYLRRFEVAGLKIDRSFVMDIPGDESDLAIIKAILSLAKVLNLDTVAEGVETEEQQLTLTEQGCTYLQGFLLARPEPPEQVEQLLKGVPANG